MDEKERELIIKWLLRAEAVYYQEYSEFNEYDEDLEELKSLIVKLQRKIGLIDEVPVEEAMNDEYKDLLKRVEEVIEDGH